jgi:predicted CXXCH cytochrome family protein
LNKSYKHIALTLIIAGMVSVSLIIANGYTSSGNSDVCFACHEDPDLFTEKDGKKISLYVNSELYKNSVHSSIECTDCHNGYDPNEIPHTKTETPVDCKSCHGEQKGIDRSVHANVKCGACHSKHEVKPAKEFAKEQTKSCLKCHNKKSVTQYSSSIHAQKNVGCELCHQSGQVVKKTLLAVNATAYIRKISVTAFIKWFLSPVIKMPRRVLTATALTGL